MTENENGGKDDMGAKDHERSEKHARDMRVKRERERRQEQREGWTRSDFYRDLGRASRHTDEKPPRERE